MIRFVATVFACLFILNFVGCSAGSGSEEKSRSPNGSGDDDSSSESSVPKSPSDLEAIAGLEDITLVWRDNSDNESGFRIYFRDAFDDEAPYVALVDLGANTSQFYHYVGPDQYL
ncbi:MAG TPA: hypothetical protein ENF73_04990, partial [Proteobacteria bacterium]|nr:hypothetical protein [Pseudomonadota bacterium]